ncbi:MAG: hypothetical protein ABSF69_25400 [Polyangiaceae bacterium]|jgi:hypothetical protein
MRELRARRRGGVTDQGSRPEAPERIVASKETADGNKDGESLHLRAAQRCVVCGRASRFVRWWPSRAMRRRL